MATTLDATGTVTAKETLRKTGTANSDSIDHFREFSGDARNMVGLKVEELKAWLIAEARREAERCQEDFVSKKDVEIAVSRLKEGHRGSLQETLLMLGGTLLGVSLSSLLSIFLDADPRVVPTIAVITGIVAGLLVAATWRRRR